MIKQLITIKKITANSSVWERQYFSW